MDILEIGDSIGEGSEAKTDKLCWFNQLVEYLQDTYDVGVHLTNISMGGNSSYAGYVRTQILDDKVDYDLAIICYGQNDGQEGFSTYYESIIRAVELKYPDCSIISILESAQKEYTEKMVEIQELAYHYGIPVVDTIASFQEVGFEELSDDGVHPNDAGHTVCFESVKNVIDREVKNDIGKMAHVGVMNEDVKRFDNFEWYGVDQWERTDNIFTLNTTASGTLGIDYMYLSGDNTADIYIDGDLYVSPTVTFDYDFSQRHILIVNKNCTVENEIKVEFGSQEQADGFAGMCFSW